MKTFTIWLTGLPCSGKTTIANLLKEKLKEFKVEIIDGDVFRKEFAKDLGFSEEDRKENMLRAAIVAKTANMLGYIAIVALVSPYREVREKIKNEMIKNFLEVYVTCPIEECEKRDVKGMYAKAKKGEIKDFTGVGGSRASQYEPPYDPDVVCFTLFENPEFGVEKIIFKLKQKGWI